MPKNILSGDDSLLPGADAELVRAESNRLGLFTPGSVGLGEYMPTHDASFFDNEIANYRNLRAEQEAIVSRSNHRQEANRLAEQKRAALEEAARLKAGEVYRKAKLLYNPDGTLQQDSDLELHAKNFVNTGLDLWNKANDFVPDFLIKDKTLDIDSRLKGTVAGMAHEDLSNKSIFAARDMTKKQVLDTVNSLVDDPNGQGTLYYLRKYDGEDENGQPKYLYKPGFAQLNAADRYREQAVAAGWDIVKEVQSSGSAETEKLIQAKFIGDRALSYDHVKGADGKEQSRDKASGINFGSGYGEIYNKDILGWDKKPSKGDVNKFKVGALKDAAKSGITGEQLKAYRATLDGITPDQLHQMKLDDNKARSYSKRDSTDAYEATHYKDDAWTGAKAGLAKFGREALDVGMDVMAVEGMDRTSAFGDWLKSDGKGNSERLDEWKTQKEVDKYVNYDRRDADEFANSLAYHAQKGDYVGALGAVFSQGGLNMTAESLGYMAPTLLGAMLATPFTGGASDVAAAAGIGSRLKAAFSVASEAKAAYNAANVAGRTAEAAVQAEKITAANAIINSSARTLGSKMETAANVAKNLGFYGQASAMTNERIDERIKNNGGQPTSVFENAGVFAESVVENYIDRAIDLSVLGMAGHKEMQQVYSLLDKTAKANIATKVAAKAVALMGSAGVEGATEYVQGIGQSFAEQYDTKKNGGTIAGILSSKENQEEGLTNFLMGVAAGTHMQAIPSGIGLATEYGMKGINNLTGKTAKLEGQAKMADLTMQVYNGTADPYNNTVSYSGKDELSAKADVTNIATGKGRLPLHVAAQAISEVNGQDVSGVSTMDMIGNLNKSLKTAHKIDEAGNGPTEGDTAAYNQSLYMSAMRTMQNIVKFTDDTKKHLAGQGVAIDKIDTTASLAKVMDAYESVLPAASMNMLKLNIAHDIVDQMQKNSSKAGIQVDEKTAVGEQLMGGSNESYGKIKIASLEEAIKSMNVLLGSGPTQVPPTGGRHGFTDDGSFSTAHVNGSISEVIKAIRAKIDEANKDGSSAIDEAFFDHLKSLDQVGTEILFRGKINGKKRDKGVYQHATDILDDIEDVQNSSKGKTKINRGNLSSFVSFATGRVKPRVLGSEFKQGEVYPASKLYNSEEIKGGTSYGYNYFPQMDKGGKTTEQKIFEARHFIAVAKQIKASIIDANQLSEDDKQKINEDMDAVIEQQTEDIATLSKYLAMIRDGDLNKGKVLANLRWKGITKTEEIKELLKLATTENGFLPDAPVFAYISSKDYVAPNSNEMPHEIDNTADNTADKPADESATKAKTSNNTKEEADYASAKDGAKSDYKTKQEEGKVDEQKQSTERSSEQRKPDETSGETATSAKDTEDDTQRDERDTKSSERKPSSVNDIFASAEKDIELTKAEIGTEAEAIALENGIEGFSYDAALTAAENMRVLKKLLTVKINELKKQVKTEIGLHFTKIDKLSMLLTSVLRGTGLPDTVTDAQKHKLNKSDELAEATALHASRTTSASVSKNEDIKAKEQRRKLVGKLLVRAQDKTRTVHQRNLDVSRLANMLDMTYDAPVTRKEASGFAAKLSHEENGTFAPLPEDVIPTKAEVAELERIFAEAESFSSGSEEQIEPQSAIDEDTEADEPSQDYIDGIVEAAITEAETDKQMEKATDPKLNIFEVAGKKSAKAIYDENKDKIASIKKEIKAKKQVRIDEVEKYLRSNAIKEHGLITTPQDKALREQAKQQVENEMKDC